MTRDERPRTAEEDLAKLYDEFLQIARHEASDPTSTGIRSKMALDRYVNKTNLIHAAAITAERQAAESRRRECVGAVMGALGPREKYPIPTLSIVTATDAHAAEVAAHVNHGWNQASAAASLALGEWEGKALSK